MIQNNAVIFFRRRSEIADLEPGEEDSWLHLVKEYGTDGFAAIEAYSNTKCPASQFIEANNPTSLQLKIEQMIRNYEDPQWLEENLYPYL